MRSNLRLWFVVPALAVCVAQSACKTPGGSSEVPASQTLSESAGSGTYGVGEPWRAGNLDGVDWEVRFNFPDCKHPPNPDNAWCTKADRAAATQKSGVEPRLLSWINDPAVKSIYIAYFSFSNFSVRKALCEAANSRGLKVTVYLHRQNIDSINDLATCSPANIKVVPRGTTFGVPGGYLQHAKIFMASDVEEPVPASVAGAGAEALAKAKIRFTSSSGNLSSNGTSLHYDNWIFFTAPYEDYLAQANLCYFQALRDMKVNPNDGNAERKSLAELNHKCLTGIKAPPHAGAKWYPVPHGNLTPQPLPALLDIVTKAKSSLKVSIHRLTTTSLSNALAKRQKQGTPVEIVYDDDTLRKGKCSGGAAMDVGGEDVQSQRILKDAGVKVWHMQTNGEEGQLHHNKYVIADDRVVFQGAGNFTATSFNAWGFGNMEYFYIFTDPAIVKAYVDGWEYERSISTAEADHPVGKNQDKELTSDGDRIEVDEGSCQ